jgi:hypothetical protein
MYKICISSEIWANFVNNSIRDNLMVSIKQMQISLDESGIIERGIESYELVVKFESKERAVEFLLRWS